MRIDERLLEFLNGMKARRVEKPLDATAIKKSLKTEKAAPLRKTDKVEISRETYLTSKLKSELKKPEETDPARLEAIREAIENGDYKVDPDKIAEVLLGD
jgi:negative regulator of flagellin synthesis FlgM